MLGNQPLFYVRFLWISLLDAPRQPTRIFLGFSGFWIKSRADWIKTASLGGQSSAMRSRQIGRSAAMSRQGLADFEASSASDEGALPGATPSWASGSFGASALPFALLTSLLDLWRSAPRNAVASMTS